MRRFLGAAAKVLVGLGVVAFFGSGVVALLAGEAPAGRATVRIGRTRTPPSLTKAATTRAWMQSAWLPLAAEESGQDLTRLEAAIAQTSGSDRWELERNRIYLDGQIFAELSLSKPNKWFLVYVWACSRSPD